MYKLERFCLRATGAQTPLLFYAIILCPDSFLLLQFSSGSHSCDAVTQVPLVLPSVPHTILCHRPYMFWDIQEVTE